MKQLLIVAMVLGSWVLLADDNLEALDAFVARREQGETLNDEELKAARNAFNKYTQALTTEYMTADRAEWPVEGATRFYMAATKISILDKKRHGGWMYRYARRQESFPLLKSQIEQSNDPFLLLAVIVPAIDTGEVDYACSSYSNLVSRRPFLAEFAVDLLATRYGHSPAALAFLDRVEPDWKSRLIPGEVESSGDSQITQTAMPSGLKASSEMMDATVKKVYAVDGEKTRYRAYVVDWKGHEVVVPDMFAKSDKKIGDTIRFMVQDIDMTVNGEQMHMLQFMLMEMPSSLGGNMASPGNE